MEKLAERIPNIPASQMNRKTINAILDEEIEAIM